MSASSGFGQGLGIGCGLFVFGIVALLALIFGFLICAGIAVQSASTKRTAFRTECTAPQVIAGYAKSALAIFEQIRILGLKGIIFMI
jgi:hypothetical protein